MCLLHAGTGCGECPSQSMGSLHDNSFPCTGSSGDHGTPYDIFDNIH